jgi:hypothetical protein
LVCFQWVAESEFAEWGALRNILVAEDVMTPDQVQELPEYNGLFFDPDTGHMYREDGTGTGFTFERARWTGPFNLHFSWPWLNPIAFATHETAMKILQFGHAIAPPSVTMELDEARKDLGPFTRTVERLIVVSNGTRSESYSAGWLANSIIRNGDKAAAESWKAEWRLAGIQA